MLTRQITHSRRFLSSFAPTAKPKSQLAGRAPPLTADKSISYYTEIVRLHKAILTLLEEKIVTEFPSLSRTIHVLGYF